MVLAQYQIHTILIGVFQWDIKCSISREFVHSDHKGTTSTLLLHAKVDIAGFLFLVSELVLLFRFLDTVDITIGLSAA